MDQQSTFLAAEQPPEEAPASGDIAFETTVAIKGGTLTVEVIETSVGPVLQLQASGGGRRPAPIKLDRYQATALGVALRGALSLTEEP